MVCAVRVDRQRARDPVPGGPGLPALRRVLSARSPPRSDHVCFTGGGCARDAEGWTQRAGRREARAGIVRAQPRGTGAADPAGELPNRDGGLCGPGSLARYCCWRGDYQNGLEHAEAAIALARDQRLALWKGWGAMLLARALAGLGRVGDIECDVRHAYNASVSTGAGLFRTYFLSILAEVHSVRCGRNNAQPTWRKL